MKITVLSENYVSGKGVTAEHGLSLFIEVCGKKILFDMGQGENFLKNSHNMGIDVSSADMAVVSHGHYDHGGGLELFLENNSTACVYISKNAFGRFFSKNGYIGLNEKLKNHPRLVFTEGIKEVFPFAKLISAETIPISEDNYGNGLKTEIDNEKVEDNFLHEQYLLLEENGKKVLISGCSHRGVLNIASQLKPDVFIGGFHLVSLDYSSENLKYVAQKLDSLNMVYYTCHCTGIEQYGAMKGILGDKLNYICCGKSFDI